MFSHHILGAAVQVVFSLRGEASIVILYKHPGYKRRPRGECRGRRVLAGCSFLG